jgi:putative resolvase
MKLSKWAKLQGISYQTAWTWVKNNQMPVPFTKTPSGTIIVHPEEATTQNDKSCIVYCRVSSYDRKDSLNDQVKRCTDFAASHGLQVQKVVKEVASGMNDKRPKLMKIFDSQPTHIVVEHKDRLTRFGFNYIEKLLKNQGCKVLVINRDEEDETDMMKDLISVITSFCCRLYGLRRGQNKANNIKKELKE